jgi:hypothetical protein
MPSSFFDEKSKTFVLVEMQLSLMYDIFYTKAAVIHTWYGRCFRAISLLGTATAFFLFQFSAAGKDGYNRVDVAVTYILVTGALMLEAASVLRAMGSTWTCAMLRVTRWDWLHSLHVSLRRCVRIAQARRWSGSIGQLITLPDSSYKGDETSQIVKDKVTSLGSKMVSFCRDGSGRIYSTAAKKLVLKEIQRMVEACNGDEGVMRSYRGQCTLERQRPGPDDHEDGLSLKHLTSMEFDQSILAWHLATDKFLRHSKSTYDREGEGDQAGSPSLPLVEATKAVSNYMMFLLVERPYMLPSPVRPTLHLQARKLLRESRYYQGFKSPAIATAIARYSCLRKIKLFVSMYNLAAIARYIPI